MRGAPPWRLMNAAERRRYWWGHWRLGVPAAVTLGLLVVMTAPLMVSVPVHSKPCRPTITESRLCPLRITGSKYITTGIQGTLRSSGITTLPKKSRRGKMVRYSVGS